MYPVPCPNGCGAKPFRKNISKHMDDGCPLAMMDCFFKFAGCDVRLPRKEMSGHAEDLSGHLALCMVAVTELKEENARLKQQLAAKESASWNESNESRPIKYLCVTNLADSTNEQMLRSTFGQFGMVRNIEFNKDLLVAIIEFYTDDSAKNALARSKGKGITLKSHQLCLNPVY